MPQSAVKTPKKPRYIALADQLRDEILKGNYAQPDVFPTESELCEEHGVSRFTVREALRKLQTEGLIARRRGSGTVIQPAAARAGALHQPLSNVAEILQYARDTRFTFSHCGKARIPRKHAEQIGIDAHGTWHHLRGIRTRIGDEQPIALTDAYIHSDLAAAAERIDVAKSTIFQQLEELAGVTVARVTQDIQAVPASADVAEQLGVPRRSPCLRIMRCYLDQRGRIFEISVSHHPGDRFAYAMHIEVDG
ncbi:MAG: GntR family transcriptional regulator [Allosphingosinicella sp.]|uniref:GntR family transcriptional regulator n=1 Tax=Allosphingosinicella sp. TaxID=2823234 RepID=UPI003923FE0C